MTDHVVTDAAVEAAMKEWVTLNGAPGSWTIEGNIRAVLEAAAPHMPQRVSIARNSLAQIVAEAEACGSCSSEGHNCRSCLIVADAVLVALRGLEAAHTLSEAWSKGHAAGRNYQGDGWNSDAHNPEHDNPYR